jgi:hypothetical protein
VHPLALELLAGALPLYESMVVLGGEAEEQELDMGPALDAEEPPQLVAVLEQVLTRDTAMSFIARHVYASRCTRNRSTSAAEAVQVER